MEIKNGFAGYIRKEREILSIVEAENIRSKEEKIKAIYTELTRLSNLILGSKKINRLQYLRRQLNHLTAWNTGKRFTELTNQNESNLAKLIGKLTELRLIKSDVAYFEAGKIISVLKTQIAVLEDEITPNQQNLTPEQIKAKTGKSKKQDESSGEVGGVNKQSSTLDKDDASRKELNMEQEAIEKWHERLVEYFGSAETYRCNLQVIKLYYGLVSSHIALLDYMILQANNGTILQQLISEKSDYLAAVAKTKLHVASLGLSSLADREDLSTEEKNNFAHGNVLFSFIASSGLVQIQETFEKIGFVIKILEGLPGKQFGRAILEMDSLLPRLIETTSSSNTRNALLGLLSFINSKRGDITVARSQTSLTKYGSTQELKLPKLVEITRNINNYVTRLDPDYALQCQALLKNSQDNGLYSILIKELPNLNIAHRNEAYQYIQNSIEFLLRLFNTFDHLSAIYPDFKNGFESVLDPKRLTAGNKQIYDTWLKGDREKTFEMVHFTIRNKTMLDLYIGFLGQLNNVLQGFLIEHLKLANKKATGIREKGVDKPDGFRK